MLRTILRYWILAAVLAAIGATLYSVGGLQQRTAAAHQQLLTLQFAGSGGEYDAMAEDVGRMVPVPGASGLAAAIPGATLLTSGVREQRATTKYWQQQYGELALKTSATGEVIERDPVLLLLAANAAYRDASRDESSPTAVQRLEVALAQYADVLKRGSWQYDAAYNYEFVTRRRDALIKARSARAAERRDLPKPPPGTTLHGLAGSVPPGTDMSDFKIVVPQRSDERREQPEAGKGGPKQRKG